MEKMGDIIRKHRLAKNMTQEELGKKVFVSKQAVSKWETGRAMPDIEMIRKLCEILEINKDEILGGSIEETKEKRKWLKACIVITVVSLLLVAFFGLGGAEYIDRNTQSGVAFLSVFYNGELLPADEYTVSSALKYENRKNGYQFDVDYGEARGTILLPEAYEIDFGFVNTNNWHNIQIRLDIDQQNGALSVTQTISYETDHDIFQVLVTEASASGKTVSVFCDGVGG